MTVVGGQAGALGYLDFEVEVDPDTGQGTPLTVRSPGGEARETLRLPFDGPTLAGRLRALEAAVRRPGRDARTLLPVGAPTAAAADVEAFGRALFAALLPGAARDCYVRSRELARQGRRGLRLRLRVRDAALAALPWEFLYDEAAGGYLCLSQHTPVVRHPDAPQPGAPLPIVPPLRVLGLVASPAALPALDAAAERAWVEAALAPLQEAGRVELVWVEGQTWRALRETLLAGPWHIFHFIGHGGVARGAGEADGYLALADEADPAAVYRLGAAELGMLLGDRQELRLVVLNACEGARAARDDPGGPGGRRRGLRGHGGHPGAHGPDRRGGDAVRDQRPGGHRVRPGPVRRPGPLTAGRRRGQRRAPEHAPGGAGRPRVGDARALPARPRRRAVRYGRPSGAET